MGNETKGKHTPGPWKEYAPNIGDGPDENYRYIEAGIGTFAETAEGVRGFQLSGYIDPKDAALIAAAPELLEACKNAAGLLADIATSQSRFSDEAMGALSFLHNAIAKAEWK